MAFDVPWLATLAPDGTRGEFVPVIHAFMVAGDGRLIQETFVIDSGADVSMASRRLVEELGYDWNSGTAMTLHGISPQPECAIEGRVFEIEIVFPDAECSLPIPICFADIDTTNLLGRRVFFDAFEITFRKANLLTSFDLLL